MSMPSAKELRLALKRAMPPEAFKPQPLRGVRALCMAGFAVACGFTIVFTDFPWFIDLLLSLLIGECMTSVLLCAHESMHGAVFESRWARSVLAWAGFAPLLITPGLWHAWHNRAHHRGANQPEYDPDTLASMEQFRGSWTTRIRAYLSPGSGHWISCLGYFSLFTLEGQFYLWVASGEPPLSDRTTIDRTKLRLTSTLLIACWLALAISMGPLNTLWVLVIPISIANLILMAYVSTQHWLRPQVEEDDPFCSAMSVHVPKFVDWLHFEFSYHQEHHIFPNLSGRYAPLLREKLYEIEPKAVAVMPMGKAMSEVLRLPILYANNRTLVTPDETRSADLHEVAKKHNLPSRFEDGIRQDDAHPQQNAHRQSERRSQTQPHSAE